MTQGTWCADLDDGADIDIGKGDMADTPLYEGCKWDKGDYWSFHCEDERFDDDPDDDTRKLVPKSRVLGTFFKPD